MSNYRGCSSRQPLRWTTKLLACRASTIDLQNYEPGRVACRRRSTEKLDVGALNARQGGKCSVAATIVEPHERSRMRSRSAARGAPACGDGHLEVVRGRRKHANWRKSRFLR